MPPQLQNFHPEAFLNEIWQKQPVFIKNPWKRWCNPLEPEELAGLACEDDIESRLIVQNSNDWKVEHGPLPHDRFNSLRQSDWTLLVQAVDHYVPAVAALIEPFRFIPDWRIDDVMVSYAADNGGVGPHFDQYDVFLIQGLGKRRWQVGEACDEDSTLMPNDDLRLLADFQPVQEWLCEPGDILYIPPGISHNGIAVGTDCMTYSIGFRAPSRRELLSHWVDEMPANIDDVRYGDPDLQIQNNPGEISTKALDQLHMMVADAGVDREEFADWFGLYATTPKYPEMDWSPEESFTATELKLRIQSGSILCKNPASRFSFINRASGSFVLFVDGQAFEYECETADLAQHICSQQAALDTSHTESETAAELLAALYNQGSLFLQQN